MLTQSKTLVVIMLTSLMGMVSQNYYQEVSSMRHHHKSENIGDLAREARNHRDNSDEPEWLEAMDSIAIMSRPRED